MTANAHSQLNAALFGRYTIERELGAGGMATVYLAHDVRHDRKVAVKVLRPELSAILGAERFLAEIKTTANLQHPHILSLFDSGEADGTVFYVMPYVEGESLRDRIRREQQLPIEDAVRIAREVLDALQYAHDHGIVHRDIKPENILLHGGHAMVADFGIALAASKVDGGTRMTETGMSLGTPHYMAPEQAMGERVITGKADVYALGAVLYEMLTGEPPFTGQSAQAVFARVLTDEPRSLTLQRKTIPPHIEAAVHRALQKLPADRFGSATEFASALASPGFGTGGPFTPGTKAHRVGPSRFDWRVVAVAVASGMALGAPGIGLVRGGGAAAAPGVEVTAELAPINGTDPVFIGIPQAAAVSNDGSRIAFLGIDSTRVPMLFVRGVANDYQWTVPASEFAASPTISPNGRMLAYVDNGIIVIEIGTTNARRVGGVAGRATGLAWLGDSSLVYTQSSGLYRIAIQGGEPERIAAVADTTHRYRWPSPTADGRAVLFEHFIPGGSRAAVVWLDSRKVEDLGFAGSRPQLVGGDVLTYSIAGSLLAVRVDPRTLRPRGTPVVLGEGGATNFNWLPVSSPSGLTLVPRRASADESELLIVSRSGNERQAIRQRQPYRYPRFSPDGNRLAFGVSGPLGPGSGDIWVLNIATGTTLRVTTDTINYHPEWSPDGRSLFFVSRSSISRQADLRRVSADGGIPTTVIAGSMIWEMAMTPDQRSIVYRADVATGTGRDIFVARVDSGPVVTPLLASRFDEKGVALSPDGRWLAYSSDEAGPSDVYIRRLDPTSARLRVSQGGGVEPRWAKNGELFFRRGDSLMVTRPVLAGATSVPEPKLVLRANYEISMFEALWDVSPDGQRFVFVRRPDGGRLRLGVIVNWLDRVRRSN